MQLESQVEVAKSYLSSQDVDPAGSNDTAHGASPDLLNSLIPTVNLLLTKLATLPDNLAPKTQAITTHETIKSPEGIWVAEGFYV